MYEEVFFPLQIRGTMTVSEGSMRLVPTLETVVQMEPTIFPVLLSKFLTLVCALNSNTGFHIKLQTCDVWHGVL